MHVCNNVASHCSLVTSVILQAVKSEFLFILFDADCVGV